MTALLVVLMFAGFAALDVLVRTVARRMDARRARREREAVLATAVRVEYTAETPTLTRVEVPGARARILAVDDERIILDSFRKILVLAGYNVDTVTSGPEALGLVQRNDYDFVFTDLKMPEMDGVEVVKAVKQLRPDVDVAVITGYATVESAVATMQYGAVDYVQKPFTEDELLAFVRRLVVRREARLEAARRPRVRLATPAATDEARPHEYYVVGGAFYGDGHTWARVEESGQVRIGLDDFARRALGSVESLELPLAGATVLRGGFLFGVRHGDKTAHFVAPVAGKVVRVNPDLARQSALVVESPYEDGWVCTIEPSSLAVDLRELRIGQPAVEWYQDEIERLRAADPSDWRELERQFFTTPTAARPAAAHA